MCGLWFRPHKPNMNVFLKPFVTELSNLSRSGFKWIDATNSKQIVTKVFPIIPVAAMHRLEQLYRILYSTMENMVVDFVGTLENELKKAKGSAVFIHCNNHSLKFVLLNNV
ncbi:hypothetical protein AVEN_65146-1 [Araneus ventricosus]|uniref:Uncharacterized protein n=1 Tax=Araneus ventricosus TaxID=182803 RepID=A0A4Y2AFA4_ARAVE|nr:hypothetical protein AVEN_65146-1 [Araneus ventricosus]